jgi:flagellar secretion chaperone FliS
MTYPLSQNESYRKTQIDTASPETLILMLYDGALRFMTQAEDAFTAANNEGVHNALVRVQAIITELLTALDKEKGGEIAINLERLYIFFLDKLSEANIKKDPEPVRQIRPLIESLRDTWAEAMKVMARQNTAPPAAPPRPRLNIAG